MDSDYRRWENIRQTKQMRGCEGKNIHNPRHFTFWHSASRARQDRALCEKTLFRYHTEGYKLVHLNVPQEDSAAEDETTETDQLEIENGS